MKKTTSTIVMALLCLIFSANAQAQLLRVSGQVKDENQRPIPSASIRIKNTQRSTNTDAEGKFQLESLHSSDTIQISYLGYQTISLPATSSESLKNIILKESSQQLKTFEVSTGYQSISKERATGSFTSIDSSMLSRRISTNILDRLEGISSGLSFNRNQPGSANNARISVRGRSTLFANANPLIVLDNFPYEGELNNINPNDIASITILKDAAAASIWGVRAGNGVIVITSKKGKRNSKPVVSLDANLSLAAKPDLNYLPQLSSPEYLEVEQFLFNKGYFNSRINNGYEAISPAVAILQRRKTKSISAADSLQLMKALQGNDIRKDINQYLNRVASNQQYLLSISGGGIDNQYYLSAGYDQHLQTAVSNSYERFTLNAKQQYTFLEERLKWNTSLLLAQSRTRLNNAAFISPYPYAALKDADGNPAAVIKDLRQSYIDTVGKGKLLDWRYIPLQENKPNNTGKLFDYRIGSELNYQISGPLRISANLLYQKGLTDNQQHYAADAYFTRNLINTYSRIDPLSGNVNTAIPYGAIIDQNNSEYQLKTGRLQLNYQQRFHQDHEITALVGLEARSNTASGHTFRLYGYDASTGLNGNAAINFTQDYPQYYGFGSARLANGLSSAGSTDNNRSYYSNLSYGYKNRYLASASARWDESNIFGVKANQKGVPLWSAGLSWILSEEEFFPKAFLPLLKLRGSYGYNGNVDKTATAFLTSRTLGGLNDFNNPYLLIVNPPNPSLSWEKVQMTNIGLDFAFKNQIISGSIEYYNKHSTDLIANSPLAPQTGMLQFRGNAADLKSHGIDLSLNAQILKGSFQWNSTFLLNYAEDKVSKYQVKQGSNRDIVQANYNNPLEGYPYFSIFSFPSASLDANGNPQGYLNGAVNNNMAAILNSKNPEELRYHGPGLPPVSGSLLQNFEYKGILLSFNLSYKLGHYYRRNSINYNNLFAGNYQQADFQKRWQQKGDEAITSVPAMNYPANANRNVFYSNSSSLIEKADHIRLQDIRLVYSPSSVLQKRLSMRNLQFFVYASNLGILWRKSNYNLDPDSPSSTPLARSIAFGLKANL